MLLQVDVADGVAARAPVPRRAAGRAPLGHHPGVGDGVPQAGRQPQDEASLCEYACSLASPATRNVELICRNGGRGSRGPLRGPRPAHLGSLIAAASEAERIRRHFSLCIPARRAHCLP